MLGSLTSTLSLKLASLLSKQFSVVMRIKRLMIHDFTNKMNHKMYPFFLYINVIQLKGMSSVVLQVRLGQYSTPWTA